MFGKATGEAVQPGWFFRPMSQNDVPTVLDIIRAHDEDDAEWAAQTYQNRGLHGHFVLTQDKRVAGVSGYALADGTQQAYWISWTYLDEASQGQGLGSAVLERIFQKLEKEGARKVFVSTSDYEEEGSNIYASAVRMYESAGFQLEVKTPDFYDIGESQLIFGMQLNPSMPPSVDYADRANDPIELTRLFRIDETDDCAGLDWDFAEEEDASFSVEDLASKLNEARTGEARCVFISFASDLTQVLPILERCQFHEAGRLKDFWANGIDDVRYVFTLKR
ncbi:MAG: GNAT superfamily N-acetyltransferase [Verrucomicrobiales bacterium]|jgi:GNAT superfamily N-acetyltransferase